MFLALKLVALAVACIGGVALPILAAILWLRRVMRVRMQRQVEVESVAVVVASLTVLAFLVALTCLGWPDNSWLESDPTSPGQVGIQWSRREQ